LPLLAFVAVAACSGPQERPDASDASEAPAQVVLAVRVLEYHSDAMHSTDAAGGHPDWFDGVVCAIEAPETCAGEHVQIWGWNRQGGLLDKRFHQVGAVVHIKCVASKRSPAPWASGPPGFGQWEIAIVSPPTQ